MIETKHLRGPLGWSLLSIAFIIVYTIYACSTILSPLFSLSGSAKANSQVVALVEQHDANIAIDIARFNGRSAFFEPIRRKVPPPPPPPPPPPGQDEIKESEVSIPFVDPVYRGPPLIAIIGDEAWFRGSGSGFDAVIRLQPGEESNGIVLVSTTEPSAVSVEYNNGEYILEMFDYEEPFFAQDPPSEVTPSFLDEVEVESEGL